MLPLHFVLIWIIHLCLLKPSRFRYFHATVAAVVISILLCVFFFIGAEWFPVSFEEQSTDCVQAVEWTQTSSFQTILRFQPDNVFVMGYSSGANLACLVSARGLPFVRGCISVCGLMDEQVVRRWPWMVWFWSSIYGSCIAWKGSCEWLPSGSYQHALQNRSSSSSWSSSPPPPPPPVPAPTLVVTGSWESPALQQSTFRFALNMSTKGKVPIHFLHLPYMDHWTILDDILYDKADNDQDPNRNNKNQFLLSTHTPSHMHLSQSKPLLYHLNNFIFTHMHVYKS